jgi:predicted transcriptional regulator
LALKSLAIDDINYEILKAALLGDTLRRIARKARVSEATTRKHLRSLEESRQIGKNRRGNEYYYFVEAAGERFILRYEATLATVRQ